MQREVSETEFVVTQMVKVKRRKKWPYIKKKQTSLRKERGQGTDNSLHGKCCEREQKREG